MTSIVDEAEFDAERWYGILAEQKVTVWYTAPTAIRMMMKVGAEVIRKATTFAALRFIASVGEPLNPEAVVWGQEAFGLPIHDNWWQTETGGIMIANYRRDGHQARLDGPAAAGHRGRPSCGVTQDGTVEAIDEAGDRGRAGAAARLAVDVPRLPARGGALPQVLRRRLVPDRRPRAARRRRLLLVRRPRRRRDQVGRPPDRPVRGRERADGASGGRRGRRDRQARPDGRRDRQGVRRAEARLRRRATTLRTRAARLRAQAARAPRWRRRRSTSAPTCRRPAAARSCAGC